MKLLQDIWDGILELTSQFVIPDWGSVIALLPGRSWASRRSSSSSGRWSGTARLGPRRRRPAGSAGDAAGHPHAGPDLRPVLRSGRHVPSVRSGLVFPGPLLFVGHRQPRPALLFWGAEGLRDYDHVAGDHPQLPAARPRRPAAGGPCAGTDVPADPRLDRPVPPLPRARVPRLDPRGRADRR